MRVASSTVCLASQHFHHYTRKSHHVSLILATSQQNFTVWNTIIPLVSPMIGGGFVILGTWLQARTTRKHARRERSIEAARKDSSMSVKQVAKPYVER